MSVTTERVDESIAVTRWSDDSRGYSVVVTTTMTMSEQTLIEVRLSDGVKRMKHISFYIPNEHARLFAEQILTNTNVFEQASKNGWSLRQIIEEANK